MNLKSSTTSNSPRPASMQSTIPAAAEGTNIFPTAADRMYQIAALTAGIFLLATLL